MMIEPQAPSFHLGEFRIITQEEFPQIMEQALDGEEMYAFHLKQVDFGEAFMEKVDWKNCLFESCKLQNVKANGSYFSDISFSGCNFSGANLSDCVFSKARLQGCKLTGTNLYSWRSWAIMLSLPNPESKLCCFKNVSFHTQAWTNWQVAALPLRVVYFILRIFITRPLMGSIWPTATSPRQCSRTASCGALRWHPSRPVNWQNCWGLLLWIKVPAFVISAFHYIQSASCIESWTTYLFRISFLWFWLWLSV